MTNNNLKIKIIIIGAGDCGSATAIRLFNAGFRPILLELDNPLDLHYFRTFSDTVYRGEKRISGIASVYAGPGLDLDRVESQRQNRQIPYLIISDIPDLTALEPSIVIDCSNNAEPVEQLDPENFDCLIRIGNQFRLGADGHFIIGSSGPKLGQIVNEPQKVNTPETSELTNIAAPFEGIFISLVEPGERVTERHVLGKLNEINILAPVDGYICGLLHSGHFVKLHQSIIEIVDLKSDIRDLKTIPVDSFAIAGGVLEAILKHLSTHRIRTET